MARLRLVEPLSESATMPEMVSPDVTHKTISDEIELSSVLQLFLLWPKYASALLRFETHSIAVDVSYDSSLSEIEYLYLKTDLEAHELLKKKTPARLMFEVFGLTYQFVVDGVECATDYEPTRPCVALPLPHVLEYVGVRKTRRKRIENPVPLAIAQGGKTLARALLVEVSPTAFQLRCEVLSDALALESAIGQRLELQAPDAEFEVIVSAIRGDRVIVKPLVNEPKNFGIYFNIYIKYVYPMLRPRHSFAEDPIPELAIATGQAKKFVGEFAENSAEATAERERWLKEVNEAYWASFDAQHQYTADYVAVDDTGRPIGTSSLAKAFKDADGKFIWAFHGLGIKKEPEYFEHTVALYLWRADYLMACDKDEEYVGWFDSRGRWLEKVYIKFHQRAPETTKLWPVRLDRYEALESHVSSELVDVKPSVWTQIRVGRFERSIYSSRSFVFGVGAFRLNVAGILNIFFSKTEGNDLEQSLASIPSSQFFFIARNVNSPSLQIKDYSLNEFGQNIRQFISDAESLRYFRSSVEHALAIVRQRYERAS